MNKDKKGNFIMISNKEIWRALCTHKDPLNGQSTLRRIKDGKCQCYICGLEFKYDDEELLTSNLLKDVIVIRIHGSMADSKMDLYFKNKYVRRDISLDGNGIFIGSLVNRVYIYDERIKLNNESFEDHIFDIIESDKNIYD